MAPIYTTVFQMYIDTAMINKLKLYLKDLLTCKVLSCIFVNQELLKLWLVSHEDPLKCFT